MKNNIRQIRLRLGMTQRQLASGARTSQQQIQRVEATYQDIKIVLALKICLALRQPLEDVFPATKGLLSNAEWLLR